MGCSPVVRRNADTDLAIIGGGPAGLAAALGARREGLQDIVIIERRERLGGILRQCIHTGFGLKSLGKDLTGPEYASAFAQEALSSGVGVLLSTTVLSLAPRCQGRVALRVVGPEIGMQDLRARSVVLAMGCRERPRAALIVPGTRPAGVFSAGTVQYLVNVMGYLPGRRAAVLGSGDVGLIVARRLALEGVSVAGVFEILPYPGGLLRNVSQCLDDFGIPLRLRRTVIEVRGLDRVEGVVTAQVDDERRPMEGTEELVECDTLVVSAGLVPENELSRASGVPLDPATGGPLVDEGMQTLEPGVFACGNVVYPHDLVDDVTAEGYLAGAGSARFVSGPGATSVAAAQAPTPTGHARSLVRVHAGEGVRYVVPQLVSGLADVRLQVRVRRPLRNATVTVEPGVLRARRAAVRPSDIVELSLEASRLGSAVVSNRRGEGEARRVVVSVTGEPA